MKPGRKKRSGPDLPAEGGTIGQVIRKIREEQSLSQQALAHRSGLSLSTLYKIESDAIKDPGYFTVVRLAGALRRSMTSIEESRKKLSNVDQQGPAQRLGERPE